MYSPKDFIETAEGLRFAVVAGCESHKVLCFLRYVLVDGQWLKHDTGQANAWLAQYHPQYLYYSPNLDAHLHAVPIESVTKHYPARERLQACLNQGTDDPVIVDLQNLCGLLQANGLDLTHWGVTGSILVGVQKASSDMDLICYERTSFQQARQVLAGLIERQLCQSLHAQDWLESYQRRGCDIRLDEYIWHEVRKLNKALYNGRKFDWSLLAMDSLYDWQADSQWQKQGSLRIDTRVTSDRLAFDYPAVFGVDHAQIQSVVCYTATYVGQAQTGEWIEVAGQFEVNQHGVQRLLVGSSREAQGEFIRVKR